KKAYNFISYDLNGNFFNLKAFKEKTKAKYFVVDFFSIVCEPCKKALPDWEKEYPEMRQKGVEMVVVALPSDKTKAKDEKLLVKGFFDLNKVSFPVMYDLFYAVGDKFGVSKTEHEKTTVEVPMVFLLNDEFKIVKKSAKHTEIIEEIKKLTSGVKK
ncbi:MAG TPA: TlpA disulfide reductase family protein, partial [bacterium]|nr:TlpA disulfide reductase family protein [bacterium]